MMKPATRKSAVEWAALAIIVAAAFALRLYYMEYRIVMIPDYDGAEYLLQASNVFSGSPFYTQFISPGFPILLRLSLFFFDEPMRAGMVVSSLFGSALCIPVYLLARDLFDRKAAFAASLITAALGTTVQMSIWVMTEMTYAFFLYSALYGALLFYRQGGVKRGAAMGILFGLAYLIRPDGFVAFAAVCAALIAVSMARGRAEVLKSLPGLGVSAAVFLALAMPYLLYLHNQLGHWTVSGKLMYNLAGGNAEAESGIGLLAQIKCVVSNYAANLPKFGKMIKLFFGIIPALLAGAGMALSLSRMRTNPMGFLLPGIPVAYLLMLPMFFTDQRIISPYLPALAIWASYAVSASEGFIASRPSLKALGKYGVLCALFALSMGATGIIDLNKYYHSYYYTYEAALMKERYLDTARWLESATRADEVVYSRELSLVYYSGRRYLNLPDLPPDRLYERAIKDGVNWVVVDDACSWRRKEIGPLMGPFMNDMESVPGFRLCYINNAGILIYRVEDGI